MKCRRNPQFYSNMQGPCSSGLCDWPKCEPSLDRATSGEMMRRDVAEALMESQYRAGMKAGWNLCATDDDVGFQARMRYEGHLKPIRVHSHTV